MPDLAQIVLPNKTFFNEVLDISTSKLTFVIYLGYIVRHALVADYACTDLRVCEQLARLVRQHARGDFIPLAAAAPGDDPVWPG